VLTGGELPAAILCDSIIRLIPGVISDETSALTDSYQDNLLAPPVYTRPENFQDKKVPPVLLSGNEAKIEQWRQDQAMQRTQEKRPNLLD
jgi:tRNA (guanine37-N1)-methyltransferase